MRNNLLYLIIAIVIRVYEREKSVEISLLFNTGSYFYSICKKIEKNIF